MNTNKDVFKVKTVNELYDILSKYQYGISDFNGNLIQQDEYKTLSPYDVAINKIAACWDFCALEDKIFTDILHINHCLYYIESTFNNKQQTHTWLSYMENGVVKSFESSFDKCMGIHKFENELQMIDFYKDKFLGEHKNNSYIVIRYNQPECHLSPQEFMKHMYKNGIVVRNYNDYWDFRKIE